MFDIESNSKIFTFIAVDDGILVKSKNLTAAFLWEDNIDPNLHIENNSILIDKLYAFNSITIETTQNENLQVIYLDNPQMQNRIPMFEKHDIKNTVSNVLSYFKYIYIKQIERSKIQQEIPSTISRAVH